MEYFVKFLLPSLKTFLKVLTLLIRGVARGGSGVNPIRTRVDRICPSQYCQPPGFKKAIYNSTTLLGHPSVIILFSWNMMHVFLSHDFRFRIFFRHLKKDFDLECVNFVCNTDENIYRNGDKSKMHKQIKKKSNA